MCLPAADGGGDQGQVKVHSACAGVALDRCGGALDKCNVGALLGWESATDSGGFSDRFGAE